VAIFVALWIAAGFVFGTAAFVSGPIYLAAGIVFVIWLLAFGAPRLRRHVLLRNR
jgi:uncharacterized protein YjeT (DUF2065 family)